MHIPSHTAALSGGTGWLGWLGWQAGQAAGRVSLGHTICRLKVPCQRFCACALKGGLRLHVYDLMAPPTYICTDVFMYDYGSGPLRTTSQRWDDVHILRFFLQLLVSCPYESAGSLRDRHTGPAATPATTGATECANYLPPSGTTAISNLRVSVGL